MSKQRVIVKSLCAKAIKGDHKSVCVLTNLIMKLVNQNDEEEKLDQTSETDQAIIDRFKKRC